MILTTIYSDKLENVVLDTDVELTTDTIDTTTTEFRRVAEALFDSADRQTIQGLLGDLPEIKNYIAWADAQLARLEAEYRAQHCDCENTDDCDCGNNWWAEIMDNNEQWPTWEKYNA